MSINTIVSKYICVKCKYNSNNKRDYSRHLNSKKHNKISEFIDKFECNNCGKSYKGQSGLWKHMTVCENDSNVLNTMIQNNESIMKALHEIKNDNDELKEMLVGITKYPINSTTINNNTINLNIFLDEKCGSAMNLDDFIKGICYESVNFTKIFTNYVESNSCLLRKNIELLPLHIRPLHYLEGEDQHQHIFHIRQNDKWKIETELNWIRQLSADDDDGLEKQTLYFALKQLDNDRLEYLRYNFCNNENYKANYRLLNSEIYDVDKKMKLLDEIIKIIKIDPILLT